jgi:radical SAM superfamily enzyme YgiQ (UPF0313 family)
MKIYLVAPKNPESFWTFDRILPVLHKKCIFPNLSLPTVAAITPPEHEVVLCDENVEPVDFDTDADVVGLTGYVVHRERILELAAEFRRRGKLVVAGGPLATLCPDDLRDAVDVLFVGEAEYTWPRFLDELAVGFAQAEYRQLEKPRMEDSPLPRFDLLKLDRYRTMTVQFGRGCPFSCEFCDIIVMYGRRPRTKSAPQMMAEILVLHQLGIRNVFVVDDNFIGNKREAKELLTALAEWQQANGRPLELMTEVSLNVAQDDELLRLMREANFTAVFVGIESPRAASLRETNKTQNLRESVLASVQRIHAAGIEVMAGMIVGFDNDDPAIFEEQFRFIQEANIPISMTGMLNAVPKTPLYERLQRAGRLVKDFVGDQFVFTNVVPQGMSSVQLYEGYRRLLRRLYGYRNYYRRVRRLILNRGPTDQPRTGGLAQDLRTFARVVWHCILKASPRRAWMTLSLILWTAVRRPGRLRDAVTLSLMHKHMHGYMRETCRRLGAAVRELKALEAHLPAPAPVPS